jgi:selenocysteine lyase/cysteine desulfurase
MRSPQTSGAALLPGQRHLFDIPDDVAFLNRAYMSPLPNVSVAAGERGLARKAQPWMITPDDFFSASETVRARFADLINAAPDDIAFAPAVSYGMAQAAANITLVRTQTVVTLAEQFPSNVYPWMDLAQRTGAQFIAVPRPGDDDWTAALLSAINIATGVVAIPHCHWTDGGLIDLEAVGNACRSVGAVLCVDGTQSVGTLPFDVKRTDRDYSRSRATSGCLDLIVSAFYTSRRAGMLIGPSSTTGLRAAARGTLPGSSTTNVSSRTAPAGSMSASAAILR